MKLGVWLCNAKPEERGLTEAFLATQNPVDLKISVSEYGGFEYAFDQYCDGDVDILDVLGTCLFYNDRSPAQITAMRGLLAKMLADFPKDETI